MSPFRRKEYGLRVKYKNHTSHEFWYGTNRDRRDQEHNRYANREDVRVVKDISR